MEALVYEYNSHYLKTREQRRHEICAVRNIGNLQSTRHMLTQLDNRFEPQ
jgi:hypothetical protein